MILMSENETEEDGVIEQTDKNSSTVQPLMENNIESHDIPTIDPTSSMKKEWDCPWCDNGFETLKSLTGHVLGKSRHDDVHDYQEFRERYAEELQAGKKKKKKPQVPSGSAAVTIKGEKAEFDPVQAQIIKELRAETEIYKERLAQKAVRDKLGDPEAEEQQQQAFFDEEQRKESALMAKDKQIERLHDKLEKEKDRAHEKEILQIKSQHKIDLKFLELESNFDLKLAESGRNFGNFNEEVNKEIVKTLGAARQSFTYAGQHNAREMRKFHHAAQRMEHGDDSDEQPEIEMRDDTDNPLISAMNPELVEVHDSGLTLAQARRRERPANMTMDQLETELVRLESEGLL